MTSQELKRLQATGNSLIVEKGGRLIFSSAERGLWPLVKCILQYKEEMAGARVIDKIVGAAAAKLLIYVKVAEIHALIASLPAKKILEGTRIEFTAEELVPNIMDRDERAPCPMEALSEKFADEEKLFEELLRRFERDLGRKGS